MACADGEPEAECYCAAVDRNQAGIVFGAAKRMILKSPALKDRWKCHVACLEYPKTGSTIRPLSRDAGSSEGINAHCIGIDELHVHKTREIFDVLEGAGSARTQPLMVIITTAGIYNPLSIWWEIRGMIQKINSGTLVNPAWFGVIYGADEEQDDWKDRDVWWRANPELGRAKKLDYMETLFQTAQESLEAQAKFKRLQLGMVTKHVTSWIEPEAWMKCGGEFDPSELLGRECYGGLDLASTTDTAAFALVFPPLYEDEPYKSLLWCWLPKDNIRKAADRDHAPYLEWAKAGHLNLTPGDRVDYNYIEAMILGGDLQGTNGRETTKGLQDLYDIREIRFDPWNATQIANNLMEAGIEMVQHRQTTQQYNEPMREFERLVMRTEYRHGDNPILTWHVSNVAIREDSGGCIKPDKAKSILRIDGACATIMAFASAAVHYKPGGSVYSERGLLFL